MESIIWSIEISSHSRKMKDTLIEAVKKGRGEQVQRSLWQRGDREAIITLGAICEWMQEANDGLFEIGETKH